MFKSCYGGQQKRFVVTVNSNPQVTGNRSTVTPPLLVIVGETASGKSALALKIAQEYNGEIICADSWTVRREVNIGTAKLTAIEMMSVPHHLLNIVGPDEDFTAAVFKGLALQKINEITARGRLPILVGGTGLYIDGVLFDYSFLDEGDRTARASLNALTVPELLQKINAIGLELGDVDTQNKRRLIRLIETSGAQPTRSELRTNTLLLGLKLERDELNQRIEKRVDRMLAAGLEGEVRQLAEHYGWDCEALKGVGYAQWKNYVLGDQTLEETRSKIIKATKDLAKRQRTWFLRNKKIHWLDTPVNEDEIEQITTSFLRTE